MAHVVLDDLQIHTRGGGARRGVPQVVQPYRRQAELGDECGEAAGQPVRPHRPAIPVNEHPGLRVHPPVTAPLLPPQRPQNLHGDLVQSQDPYPGRRLRRPEILDTVDHDDLLPDRQLPGEQVDVLPPHAGDLPTAEARATDGLEASQRVGDRYYVPRNLTILADLKARRGRVSEANALYGRAEDVIESMLISVDEPYWNSSVAASMSQTYLQHFELVTKSGEETEKEKS